MKTPDAQGHERPFPTVVTDLGFHVPPVRRYIQEAFRNLPRRPEGLEGGMRVQEVLGGRTLREVSPAASTTGHERQGADTQKKHEPHVTSLISGLTARMMTK